MKFDVILASLMVGLAIYFMTWSFSFGRNSKIYLPNEKSRWWFFDPVNELHPNLFRTVSALTAFFGTALYGHDLQFWIVASVIFAPAFAIYFFTCLRSFYLVISERADYPVD